MVTQEADDRERTAALLASVRASIQAERAAREEATAEPPAGLAELLRPPGTPRRRRAQLQREWEARGALGLNRRADRREQRRRAFAVVGFVRLGHVCFWWLPSTNSWAAPLGSDALVRT